MQYHNGPIVIAKAGDYLFTTKHHGMNKSVDGGKTWVYAMEEHSRLLGTAGQTLFREHPQGLREGGWCWAVQMSDDMGAHFSDVTGALPELVKRESPAGIPPALTNLSPFVANRLGIGFDEADVPVIFADDPVFDLIGFA